MERNEKRLSKEMVDVAMMILQDLVSEQRLFMDDKEEKKEVIFKLFTTGEVIFTRGIFTYSFMEKIINSLDFFETFHVENGVGVIGIRFDADEFLKSKVVSDFINSMQTKYEAKMYSLFENSKKEANKHYEKFNDILNVLKKEGALDEETFKEQEPKHFARRIFNE